jgi:cytochrome o ubiquinol oxidase subunit I
MHDRSALLHFIFGRLTWSAIPYDTPILVGTFIVVAHFHNVIIGGVVFGAFAGINYWFPKAFGFRLDAFWGKVSFWFWLVGFWIAFTSLYVLGLMGVTRRLSHFTDPSLQIWFEIAAFGAFLILLGMVSFLIQIVVSIRNREALRDPTGDPWDGRTLEWSTSPPPPQYNFAFTPRVHERDAWADMEQRGYQRPTEGFKPIHMPKNTGAGVILAALAFACGFGLVWYMWWLAVASFAALVAVAIGHSFNYHRDYHIAAEEVLRVEQAYSRQLSAQGSAS